MAASIIVEQEQGTYTRSPRRHNGYFAGDFGPRGGRGSGPTTGSPRSGGLPAPSPVRPATLG